MSEIGTAYVQIEPTAKGISGKIEKEMGGVGSSSGASFNKGFGSVLGGTTKLMAGAVAAGGAALAAAGASFVKASGDVAAFGDEIDKESQKLGISAEAYQEWDAIMQHTGGSVSNLKPALKTLSKEIVNNSDAFKELGLSQDEMKNASIEEVLNKTISKLQEMPAGVDRTRLATQLLGKSSVELGALLNTSVEDTEKMRQAVHDLGGVMSNDAIKAAAAYQDQLQDMQTAFQGLSRNLVSEFLPQVTQVMAGLTDIFTGNSEEGIGKISEGVKGIANGILQALPELMNVASSILGALGQALIANLPVITSAGVPIIQELAQGLISAIPTAIPALVELISALATTIISLAPQLLQAGVQIVLELANGITEALPTLIPAITEAVLQIVTMFTDPNTLTSLIQAGIDLMLALLDGLMQALPQIISQLPTIVQNICDALTSNLPIIIEAANELVSELVDNMPAIIQALIDAAPEIIDGLMNALIECGPQLIAAGPTLTAQLILGIVQCLPQFLELGKKVVDSIIQGLAAAYVKLTAEAPKMIGQLKDKLSVEIPKLIQQGRDIVKKIIDGIKQFAENLYKQAQELIEKFKAKIKEKIEGFAEVGKNIVNGIKEGLTSAWSELEKWFSEKISKLKEKVKDVLKIESPSKVFADEVGRMIPLGIAEGIEDGMRSLDTSVLDMTTGIVGTADQAMSAATYQSAPSASGDVYGLLANYLPLIANKEVNIKLEGGMDRFFRAMQAEARRNYQLTGAAL